MTLPQVFVYSNGAFGRGAVKPSTSWFCAAAGCTSTRTYPFSASALREQPLQRRGEVEAGGGQAEQAAGDRDDEERGQAADDAPVGQPPAAHVHHVEHQHGGGDVVEEPQRVRDELAVAACGSVSGAVLPSMSPLTSTAARKQSQNANPRGTRSGLAPAQLQRHRQAEADDREAAQPERPPDREERDQRGERPVRRQPDPARAQRPAQPGAAAVHRCALVCPGPLSDGRGDGPVEGAGHRLTPRPPSRPAAAARPRSGRGRTAAGRWRASTYPVTAAADRLYQEQGVAVPPETAVQVPRPSTRALCAIPVRVAQQDLLVLHVLQDRGWPPPRPACPTAASCRPAAE